MSDEVIELDKQTEDDLKELDHLLDEFDGIPNKHLKFVKKEHSIGFTNKLAIYLVILLFVGLFMGFLLAIFSIDTGYTGQLLCFTVVFTPIGTALSIVLTKIVDKSKAENLGPNGEGIKFATARANEFNDLVEYEILNEPFEPSNDEGSVDSPAI